MAGIECLSWGVRKRKREREILVFLVWQADVQNKGKEEKVDLVDGGGEILRRLRVVIHS